MLQEIFSVLVNWNLAEDTVACVQSLIAAGAALDQIIVVDNGSEDGSPAALRERIGPELIQIENERNWGFARAANQGIERALARSARWVFLLNNDTVVDPEIFQAFTRAHEAQEEFALLGPEIRYFDEPDRVWYRGHRVLPGTLISSPIRLGAVGRRQAPAVIPVDFLSGCGMLIRRQVFERIGLFDESLFMYGEEIDFCWRARKQGFQLGNVPEAIMRHKVSLSARRDPPRTRYLRVRNQARFYRAHARGLQKPLMLVFSLARSLGLAAGDLAHRSPELIPPLARGWLDGWLRQPQGWSH